MSRVELRNLAMLLTAESESVREMVKAELRERREQLAAFLEEAPELEPTILFELHELLRECQSAQMRTDWLDWTKLDSQSLQLEAAFEFLAQVDGAQGPYRPLAELLDQLVGEFLKSGHETSLEALAEFLFASGRFKGAQEDYFNPQHSNLCYVISEGRGLPISLACIMMLTGYRLGLDIQGFNLPGHFLARSRSASRLVLIDCFNGGKFLTEGEIAALTLSPKIQFQELIERPPSAAEIITRVLINLINAYHRNGDIARQVATQELLADLRHHMSGKTPAAKETGETVFRLGQVVRHRNFGYRGVIVDVDAACQADEEWYRSNPNPPEREQPWYHVLVDGSAVTTYAAQNSLEVDDSGLEVHHPLVALYFQGFQGGTYRRNNVPWNQ